MCRHVTALSAAPSPLRCFDKERANCASEAESRLSGWATLVCVASIARSENHSTLGSWGKEPSCPRAVMLTRLTRFARISERLQWYILPRPTGQECLASDDES